ncbi:hypothetical protein U0070_021301 [Myodes glareolus]|uniref:Uncharacterized protein n=1 Tax=Myodes glareolus TaxID=447135 RepID=A0AAW0JIG2_MYOGA
MQLGLEHQVVVVGAVKSLQALDEQGGLQQDCGSKRTAADGPWVFPVVSSIEDAVQRRLPLVQSGQAEKLADEERMSRGSC